ncbi:PepSY-like domain-containing protein [Aequorivita viscosa]|uniref:Putative beta-lactamase-inhibitor-like, PepSY-like n=1 Tax=Aequorivita viscosa TaxID=797419 RepID=A0A1M6B4Q1_9FLAO|nr:PepSY-like domain-containing protein [Aequorivita viscosa]SDW33114.1 Putative beta-lactamase-inhibitor-like, PepSY-like [Aequorivita viscosa]SHI43568.1 Putative beta-lactamase-inhibitor-like, PepSY-like [Aequorivita viscosa]
MKAITFLTAVLIGTTSLFAQDVPENQVPSVILNTFKKEFPKASDIEWEREGELYNVDFEIGYFTDYEAWFDASGKLIKYSEEISEKDLPQAVKDTVKKQFDGYRIDDVEKITENNIETYRVEIEKGNDERYVTFSKNGKLI